MNELPAKLEALILQLMEKDKDDRPIDAAWVVRMLEEIEEDAFARKSAGADRGHFEAPGPPAQPRRLEARRLRPRRGPRTAGEEEEEEEAKKSRSSSRPG